MDLVHLEGLGGSAWRRAGEVRRVQVVSARPWGYGGVSGEGVVVKGRDHDREMAGMSAKGGNDREGQR